MKRYWLNQKGVQSGPYSLDELEAMSLLPQDTYVWCGGMTDWKPIDEIPELASAIRPTVDKQPAVPLSESQEEPADLQGQPQEEPVERGAPIADLQEEIAQETATPQEQLDPPRYVESSQRPPVYVEHPQPSSFPQPQQPLQYQQPRQYQSASQPECPPTNLAWSIICTLLCCTPLGVVAIVFAAMVKSKYRTGNYAKAQKYSDLSAWLCIASIVLAIAMLPFTFLMMLPQ